MAKARRAKQSERPVLVVSNRLPFTVQRGPGGLERRPSAGGLVSALEPVLLKRGGTWVGWPGVELRGNERISSSGKAYRVAPVQISDAEVTRFYHGFSNRTLWPLFHSLHERARFERRDWDVYERVNQRFTDMAMSETRDADLVWVHDYHLTLMPMQLRLQETAARIAFFLHVPFPPYDVFRLLPWDLEILRGLLGADLVGFHVPGYAQNFMDCVERRLGANVDRKRGLIQYGDRAVQVGAFPIGIEFELFESRALKAQGRRPSRSERIVLGVDRLDYTKGIPERIRAFERMLELHPRHRENVVLLQLAVPSRSQVNEYRELKREIDELVGRVNGRFATASWSPIRYLYRSLPPERLSALYRDADVALITPLRDGMNLVAKEYVAAQVDEPGVLVLSRLAGAADTMHEALLVNPYDVDATAEAIHRALVMEEPERRSRLTALRRRERRYDVTYWVESFLDAVSVDVKPLLPTDADFQSWLGPFLTGYSLALFLDYDGTLTPLCDHPSKARLSPSMRRALEACAGRPDTNVTLVSGRGLDDLRAMVSDPRLTYGGNHGLEIQGPGMPDYRHEDLPHFEPRTEELAAALHKIAVDGAWVEEKGLSLTLHYRGVDPELHANLIEKARKVITEAGFQALDAHCAVEARPPIGWDKGRAVLHVLRQRHSPSWSENVRVVYVGDDRTDEDAFRLLAGLAITFRVGSTETLTHASRRLANVDSVEALLEWLAGRPTSKGA